MWLKELPRVSPAEMPPCSHATTPSATHAVTGAPTPYKCSLGLYRNFWNATIQTGNGIKGSIRSSTCWELTTLWVARLDDGAELKVTDPKEQQGDVEEEEAKGEERRDGVHCGRQGTSC